MTYIGGPAGAGQGQGYATARFSQIVDPDRTDPVARVKRRVGSGDGFEVAIGATVVSMMVVVMAAIAAGGTAAAIASALAFAAVITSGLIDLRFNRDHMVVPLKPEFEGKPIVGEGLDRLVDISDRFAFAKRKVDELPELLEWSEIAGTVEAIRWDAARHAAGLSATEAQWADVKHAPPGTPQEVLKDRLVRRREAEQKILMQYQRTADRLMNKAADAAAAATVAAELGYDLEVAVPSAAATGAVAELDRVIERLDALTDAWRALDASTDLRAAELQVEATDRDRAAGTTARRLAAELDAGTNTDTNTERADGAGSVG